MIELAIPVEWLLTSNQREHWSKKARKSRSIRDLACVMTLQSKQPKFRKAHLLCEVTWPDRRRRDVHNLAPTVKAAIDGIVTDAGILPDDDDRHLIGPDMRVNPTCVKRPGYACLLTFTFTEQP